MALFSDVWFHDILRIKLLAEHPLAQSPQLLESVCGLCVAFNGHDTSIVEQDVEEVKVGVDCLRCLSHRGVVAEIERYYHKHQSWGSFL